MDIADTTMKGLSGEVMYVRVFFVRFDFGLMLV